MRIALVNHRDWVEGGMDKVALVHLEQLQAHGHTAALFAQSHPKNRKSPYQGYFPKVERGNFHRLSWQHAYQLPQDVLRLFYNPDVGYRFGTFLDRFLPDAVHVHGLPRSFSPVIYEEAQRRDIPVIQTHHYAKVICPTGTLLRGNRTYCRETACISGNTMPCIQNQCQQNSAFRSTVAAMELAWNRKRYIEEPVVHLAPSAYLQNLLQEAGIPADKLRRHPNFVDPSCFYPGDGETEGYYLYFGRLAAEKGLQVLIDAFAPLRELPLVIIGDGPLQVQLAQQIETQQLSHIRLLPKLSESELLPWIQKAKATLLPSVWGEIFGMTVIESFACRRPVIGANIGAIPELIQPGVSGLLCESGDVLALRNSILAFERLEFSEQKQMGQTGYDHVMSHYTLEQHLAQLFSLYSQVTGVLL